MITKGKDKEALDLIMFLYGYLTGSVKSAYSPLEYLFAFIDSFHPYFLILGLQIVILNSRMGNKSSLLHCYQEDLEPEW